MPLKKVFIVFSVLSIFYTFSFTFYTSSSLANNLIYQYDELHRLSQIEYPNGTIIKYTYDAAGNRLSKAFLVLNLEDQIIQSGTYKASSITAGPNVTVASEAVVTFDSVDSISVGLTFIIEEYAHVTFKATTITAENNFIIKSGAIVIFEATDYIIVGPDFIIESGAQVFFRAGNYITILPEFTAEEGCSFEVNML